MTRYNQIADVIAEIKIVIAHPDKIFQRRYVHAENVLHCPRVRIQDEQLHWLTYLAIRYFAVFKKQHQFAVTLFNWPDLFEHLGQQLVADLFGAIDLTLELLDRIFVRVIGREHALKVGQLGKELTGGLRSKYAGDITGLVYQRRMQVSENIL